MRLFPVLLILLVPALLLSLHGGREGVVLFPLSSWWQGDELSALFFAVRVPRVLTALFAGMLLAKAGMVMQALFRNPLVEPGLLGISSGAALGVALALALGGVALGCLLPAAFAGAVLALLLVIIFVRAHMHTVGLLLAGLAVNAFCGATLALLMALLPDISLRNAVLWGAGSFADAGPTTAVVLAILTFLAMLLLQRRASALDVLLLGEDNAGALGLNVQGLRWVLLLMAALMAAVVVAFCGVIGFIGLLAPQLVRLLGHSLHATLLRDAALLGGLLSVLADMAGRYLMPPMEIAPGIFTSLLGAPFFLWLLYRSYARPQI